MLNMSIAHRWGLAIVVTALKFAFAPEAAAQTPECVPQCRSGFTCVTGACVSACNPACGAGETCSGAGECMMTARPATTASPSAPVPGATEMVLPRMDHRWELGVRLGYQFAGEVSPMHMPGGKTGGAPLAFIDVSRLVHPFFTVGVFSQFSNSSYHQYAGDISLGDGRLTLWSVGAVLKARIPVSDAFTIRVGGLVGTNLLWASGKDNAGVEYSGHGAGFDLGATLEGALRLSQRFGASAQFGFSSQILAGSVHVDGDPDSHDLAYAPLMFLAVGPEFYF